MAWLSLCFCMRKTAYEVRISDWSSDVCSSDLAQTCETIAEVFEQSGELLDPHTAIGVRAARECRRSLDIPMVILGTAHPVKFPEAVEKAGVGKALELPVHLSDLFERDERCTVLPNDLKAVQAFVSQHGNRGRSAKHT